MRLPTTRSAPKHTLVNDAYNDHNTEGKYDLKVADDKMDELLLCDLNKYTRKTDEFTETQMDLPRLRDTEVAKVTLKGPLRFAKMLASFSSDPRKKEEHKEKPRNNRNAPYPATDID